MHARRYPMILFACLLLIAVAACSGGNPSPYDGQFHNGSDGGGGGGGGAGGGGAGAGGGTM